MVSKPKRGRGSGAGKKNRGGRPPVADADRRDTLVRVLTTAAEHEELQKASAYVGMTLSTWVRFVALERARTLTAEKEAARDRDE
jgi:hypothetical protein